MKKTFFSIIGSFVLFALLILPASAAVTVTPDSSAQLSDDGRSFTVTVTISCEQGTMSQVHASGSVRQTQGRSWVQGYGYQSIEGYCTSGFLLVPLTVTTTSGSLKSGQAGLELSASSCVFNGTYYDCEYAPADLYTVRLQK